jgi:hypothetical protein
MISSYEEDRCIKVKICLWLDGVADVWRNWKDVSSLPVQLDFELAPPSLLLFALAWRLALLALTISFSMYTL